MRVGDAEAFGLDVKAFVASPNKTPAKKTGRSKQMCVDIADASRKQLLRFDKLHNMGMPRQRRLRHFGKTRQKARTIGKRAKGEFANHIGMDERFEPFAEQSKTSVKHPEMIDPDSGVDDYQRGGSSPSLGAHA